jgi:hypothetical protein
LTLKLRFGIIRDSNAQAPAPLQLDHVRRGRFANMPSDSFQIAAERAASSYPADVRFTLGPSEQAAAIYRELRKVDAESVSEPSTVMNSPAASNRGS